MPPPLDHLLRIERLPQRGERIRLRLSTPGADLRCVPLRRLVQPSLKPVSLLLVRLARCPPPDEVAEPVQRQIVQAGDCVGDGEAVQVFPVLDGQSDQPLSHEVGSSESSLAASMTFSISSEMCSMSSLSLGSCIRARTSPAASPSTLSAHSRMSSIASASAAMSTLPGFFPFAFFEAFSRFCTVRARAMEAEDFGT